MLVWSIMCPTALYAVNCCSAIAQLNGKMHPKAISVFSFCAITLFAWEAKPRGRLESSPCFGWLFGNAVSRTFFGQSWWKNVWTKLPQRCCFNMIYSQPLDIMIKSKCSFSTVCVGMAFALSCKSGDLKRDSRVSQAAPNNCNKPQQKENYSFIPWLLFPPPTIYFYHPGISALAVSSV